MNRFRIQTTIACGERPSFVQLAELLEALGEQADPEIEVDGSQQVKVTLTIEADLVTDAIEQAVSESIDGLARVGAQIYGLHQADLVEMDLLS